MSWYILKCTIKINCQWIAKIYKIRSILKKVQYRFLRGILISKKIIILLTYNLVLDVSNNMKIEYDYGNAYHLPTSTVV
jgi:hypothetical protein